MLKSVNWNNKEQREDALLLLDEWAEADLEHAFGLLSGMFSVNNIYTELQVSKNVDDEVITAFKKIREHGLKILKRIYLKNPKHIEILTLQLIQALRYEDFTDFANLTE